MAAKRVVAELAAAGLLIPGSEQQANEIVEHALGNAPSRGMPRITEVVAYLGGALVFAAGVLFVAQSWGDLGPTGHLLFLLLVSAILAGAGVVASRGADGARDLRRRLAGTLFTAAAVVGGFAIGGALDEYHPGHFSQLFWPAVVGGAVAAAGSSIGYRVRSTAVGLVGILGGVLCSAATLSSGMTKANGELSVGLSFCAVAVTWLVLAEARFFDQVTFARALGIAVAIFGAQLPIGAFSLEWVSYVLTSLVAAAGIWLYLKVTDWPYLAGAVIAVTLVVPEAITDWTDGSLGAVGGVLVAGVTLLIASLAGYRLRK